MGDVQSGEYTLECVVDFETGPDAERLANLRGATTQNNDAGLCQRAAAEMEVELTQKNIWAAEDDLLAAKKANLRARGRLWLIEDRPTWRDIFCPKVPHRTDADTIYAQCMQTGYSYACWNGRIFKVVSREQLIDTGATEQDIK